MNASVGKKPKTSVVDDLQARLSLVESEPVGNLSHSETTKVEAAPIRKFSEMQTDFRRRILNNMSRVSRRDVSSGIDEFVLSTDEKSNDDLESFDANPASDDDDISSMDTDPYLRDETQAGIWKNLKNAARAAKDKVAAGYKGYKAAKKAAKEEYKRRNDKAKEDEKYRQQKSEEKREQKEKDKEEKKRRKEEQQRARDGTKGMEMTDYETGLMMSEMERLDRANTYGYDDQGDDMDQLMMTMSDQAIGARNKSSRDSSMGRPGTVKAVQFPMIRSYDRDASSGYPSMSKQDRIRMAFGMEPLGTRQSTMPNAGADEDADNQSIYSKLKQANRVLSERKRVLMPPPFKGAPFLKQIKTRVDLASLGLSPAFTALLVNASKPQPRHMHMQGKHWSDAGSQILHVLMNEERFKSRFEQRDITYQTMVASPNYDLCEDDFCRHVASSKMTRINVDQGAHVIDVVSYVFKNPITIKDLLAKSLHWLKVPQIFTDRIAFSLPSVDSADLAYDSAFAMKVTKHLAQHQEAMVSLKYESDAGGVTGIIVISHTHRD